MNKLLISCYLYSISVLRRREIELIAKGRKSFILLCKLKFKNKNLTISIKAHILLF